MFIIIFTTKSKEKIASQSQLWSTIVHCLRLVWITLGFSLVLPLVLGLDPCVFSRRARADHQWADMEVPSESFHRSSWDSRTCYARRAFNRGLTDDCVGHPVDVRFARSIRTRPDRKKVNPGLANESHSRPPLIWPGGRSVTVRFRAAGTKEWFAIDGSPLLMDYASLLSSIAWISFVPSAEYKIGAADSGG